MDVFFFQFLLLTMVIGVISIYAKKLS